jgi:hypothetical protein
LFNFLIVNLEKFLGYFSNPAASLSFSGFPDPRREERRQAKTALNHGFRLGEGDAKVSGPPGLLFSEGSQP